MAESYTPLPEEFATDADMQAVVDKVYKEMTAEDTPPETPAGTEIVEKRPDPPANIEQVTSDANAAGNDTATGEGQETEIEAGSASAQEWLDDDLRNLATTIGIPEDKLTEFESRKELERALDLFDAKAMELGRQEIAAEVIPPKPETKKPLAPAPVETPPNTDDIAPFLFSDAVDEEAGRAHNEFVKAAFAKIKSLETAIAGFQAEQQQRATRSLISDFEKIVDELGQPELFGNGSGRSKVQQENRARLWDTHRMHVLGLQKMGRQARTDKAFVSRALYAEFGPQLTKNEKNQVIDRLRKQSARKMGGPANKPLHSVSSKDGTPKDNPEVMDDLKALHTHLANGGTMEDYKGG